MAHFDRGKSYQHNDSVNQNLRLTSQNFVINITVAIFQYRLLYYMVDIDFPSQMTEILNWFWVPNSNSRNDIHQQLWKSNLDLSTFRGFLLTYCCWQFSNNGDNFLTLSSPSLRRSYNFVNRKPLLDHCNIRWNIQQIRFTIKISLSTVWDRSSCLSETVCIGFISVLNKGFSSCRWFLCQKSVTDISNRSSASQNYHQNKQWHMSPVEVQWIGNPFAWNNKAPLNHHWADTAN